MEAGFGAFGKIPALGDFLRLNLPGGFVRPWDDWMQTMLVGMRAHMGARWEGCYLSAPIWRFSLAPGLCGARAVSGILMASVDRVGRQYPLTLAAPCAGSDTTRRHFANDAVFAQLEEIALDTLELDLGRAALADRLAGVTLAEPAAPGVAEVGAQAQQAADQGLSLGAGATAIWTAQLDDTHYRLRGMGLPDSLQAMAMFDPAASVWRHGQAGETE